MSPRRPPFGSSKSQKRKKEQKVDDILHPRGAHVGERTNVKNVVKAQFPTAHDADPRRSTEVFSPALVTYP